MYALPAVLTPLSPEHGGWSLGPSLHSLTGVEKPAGFFSQWFKDAGTRNLHISQEHLPIYRSAIRVPLACYIAIFCSETSRRLRRTEPSYANQVTNRERQRTSRYAFRTEYRRKTNTKHRRVTNGQEVSD